MSSNSKQPSPKQAMTTASQTIVARQPAPTQRMGTRSNTGDRTIACVETFLTAAHVALCCPFHSCDGSATGNECGRTCGDCNNCNDCSGDC